MMSLLVVGLHGGEVTSNPEKQLLNTDIMYLTKRQSIFSVCVLYLVCSLHFLLSLHLYLVCSLQIAP